MAIRKNAKQRLVIWKETTFGTRPTTPSGYIVPIFGHNIAVQEAAVPSKALRADPNAYRPGRGRWTMTGKQASIPIESIMIGKILHAYFGVPADSGDDAIGTSVLNAGGSGYAVDDTFTVDGSSGTLAIGKVDSIDDIGSGSITTSVLNAGGDGYAVDDTFTVDGTSGTPAVGKVLTIDDVGTGAITTSVLNAGGAGYAVDDTFTVDGSSGTLAIGKVLTITDGGGGTGPVLTYELTDEGTLYSTGSAVATTATLGVGTGLKVNITAVDAGDGVGPVVTYELTSDGTLYSTGTAVATTATLGGGTGLKVNITEVDAGDGVGPVLTYELTDHGTLYALGNAVATTATLGGGSGLKLNITSVDLCIHTFKRGTTEGPSIGAEVWDVENNKGDSYDGIVVSGMTFEFDAADGQCIVTVDLDGMARPTFDASSEATVTPETFTGTFYNHVNATLKIDGVASLFVTKGTVKCTREKSLRPIIDGTRFGKYAIVGRETVTWSLSALFDSSSTVRELATGLAPHVLSLEIVDPDDVTHGVKVTSDEVDCFLTASPAIGNANELEITVEGTAYFRSGAHSSAVEVVLTNADPTAELADPS